MAGAPPGGPCHPHQLRDFTQEVNLVFCEFLRRDVWLFSPHFNRGANDELTSGAAESSLALLARWGDGLQCF
jgi:hypothetical protein